MKLRLAVWLILVLGGCVGAGAQTVPLSASNLKDAAGASFSGTLQICPVSSAGIPQSFHFGSGGAGLNRCSSITVTSGSFSTTVPDVYLSSPQNLCLALHAWDPVTNQDDLNDPCVQPSITAGSMAVSNGWCTVNGSCNLDSYSPSISVLPQVNLNTNGGSGTWTGGTITANSAFQAPVTFGGSAQSNFDSTGFLNLIGAGIDANCGGSNRDCITGAIDDSTKSIFQWNHVSSTTPAQDVLAFYTGHTGGPCFTGYRVEYATGDTRFLPLCFYSGGTPPADLGKLFSVGGSTHADFDDGGNFTAPSVATNGSGPSGLTVTPNGTIPTAPTNSISYSAPLSVPTPYAFLPPTNVTAAASAALPIQCQYYAGPPAYLQCALTAISGGAGWAADGTGFEVSTPISSPSGFNYMGLVAATSATTDPNLYIDVPTGGEHIFRVNGTHTFTPPTSAPGTNQMMLCTTTSPCTWISEPSGSLPSQISAGQATGSYYGLSFNGSLTPSAMLGPYADSSGSDKNYYLNAPSGGGLVFNIANVHLFEVVAGSHPTGSCSSFGGTPLIEFTTGDGYWNYCDGTNWTNTAPGATGSGSFPSQLMAGQVSGNYYGIGYNGSLSPATMTGTFADSTGSDPNFYYTVPTGGMIVDKVANVTVHQTIAGSHPTGSCSGTFFVDSAGDGYRSWCNGSTYVVVSHP